MKLSSGGLVPTITMSNQGLLKFGAYALSGAGTPTKLLGVDSSGNVLTTVSGGDLPGGPYLPLSAGSSYPLTGALYVQDHLILQQDGTNDLIKSTGNVLYHKANEYSFQDNSSNSWVTIKSGNVGIGTTSPGTLHGVTYGTTKLHIDGGTDRGQLIIEGDSLANIVLSDNGATVNQRVFQTAVNGGNYQIKPLNDNGTSTAQGAAITVLHGGNVGSGRLVLMSF